MWHGINNIFSILIPGTSCDFAKETNSLRSCPGEHFISLGRWWVLCFTCAKREHFAILVLGERFVMPVTKDSTSLCSCKRGSALFVRALIQLDSCGRRHFPAHVLNEWFRNDRAKWITLLPSYRESHITTLVPCRAPCFAPTTRGFFAMVVSNRNTILHSCSGEHVVA